MPKKRVTKKPPAKKSARKPAKKSAVRPAPSRSAARGASKAASQLANLERLIEMMVEKDVVEVELEEAGARWRVRRAEPQAITYAAPAAMPMPVAPIAGAPGVVQAAPESPGAAAAAEPQGAVFKSPMVGTFYRAASPDAEPFCKPGDKVASDRTLCIIEAMKVMNEIKPEQEQEFEVLDVLVKNGESVEFGQPLFLIR